MTELADLHDALWAHAYAIAFRLSGSADVAVDVSSRAAVDAFPSLDELRAWCRERMSPYKVPKAVEFTDVLPRTTSGKVQRYKLS